MGQAKKRGTFEQRQAEAVLQERERAERERIELAQRKEAQRLHDLANPKQAAARRRRQGAFASILALNAILATPTYARSAPTSLEVGSRYRWKGQHERLVYLGHNWSGNGYWHRFEKESEPGRVWCEVLDRDLDRLEEIATGESK